MFYHGSVVVMPSKCRFAMFRNKMNVVVISGSATVCMSLQVAETPPRPLLSKSRTTSSPNAISAEAARLMTQYCRLSFRPQLIPTAKLPGDVIQPPRRRVMPGIPASMPTSTHDVINIVPASAKSAPVATFTCATSVATHVATSKATTHPTKPVSTSPMVAAKPRKRGRHANPLDVLYAGRSSPTTVHRALAAGSPNKLVGTLCKALPHTSTPQNSTDARPQDPEVTVAAETCDSQRPARPTCGTGTVVRPLRPSMGAAAVAFNKYAWQQSAICPRTKMCPNVTPRWQTFVQACPQRLVSVETSTTVAKSTSPITQQWGTGTGGLDGPRSPAHAESEETPRTDVAAKAELVAYGGPGITPDVKMSNMHDDSSSSQTSNDASSPVCPHSQAATDAEIHVVTLKPLLHGADTLTVGSLARPRLCEGEVGQSLPTLGDDHTAEVARNAKMCSKHNGSGAEATDGTSEAVGEDRSQADMVTPKQAAADATRSLIRKTTPLATDDAVALNPQQFFISHANITKGRRRRNRKRLVLSPPPHEDHVQDVVAPSPGSTSTRAATMETHSQPSCVHLIRPPSPLSTMATVAAGQGSQASAVCAAESAAIALLTPVHATRVSTPQPFRNEFGNAMMLASIAMHEALIEQPSGAPAPCKLSVSAASLGRNCSARPERATPTVETTMQVGTPPPQGQAEELRAIKNACTAPQAPPLATHTTPPTPYNLPHALAELPFASQALPTAPTELPRAPQAMPPIPADLLPNAHTRPPDPDTLWPTPHTLPPVPASQPPEAGACGPASATSVLQPSVAQVLGSESSCNASEHGFNLAMVKSTSHVATLPAPPLEGPPRRFKRIKMIKKPQLASTSSPTRRSRSEDAAPMLTAFSEVAEPVPLLPKSQSTQHLQPSTSASLQQVRSQRWY